MTPNSEHGELVERLRAVESDPIGCGLARNWYRNPDGPEAADLIESLSLRMRECEEALGDARKYVLQVAAGISIVPNATGVKDAQELLARIDYARAALNR